MDRDTPKNAARNLYEMVEGQQGIFTTKQALQAGYARKTHYYQTEAGHWIRRYRGIYQLAQFPSNPSEAALVQWSLWSRDIHDIPQGTYSHETALRIYDLSDVNPAKLHLTVPKSFRRRSGIPKVLVLHHADLLKADVEEKRGYTVVKPLPTILNFFVTNTLSMEFIEQSLHQALQRGIIRRSEITNVQIPDHLKSDWRSLVDRVRKN